MDFSENTTRYNKILSTSKSLEMRLTVRLMTNIPDLQQVRDISLPYRVCASQRSVYGMPTIRAHRQEREQRDLNDAGSDHGIGGQITSLLCFYINTGDLAAD